MNFLNILMKIISFNLKQSH